MFHSIRSIFQLAAEASCTIISARSAKSSHSRDCSAQSLICMLIPPCLYLKIFDSLDSFPMFAIAPSFPKEVILSPKVP